MKEDAVEFTDEYRLRSIIKKHSDFVPYPIYLGENKEQANQQTAIWRVSPRELKEEQSHEFYRQLTLDVNPPLAYTQINADAPVQLYALLYIPSSAEKPMFSLRKEDGLKLYARKVLIKEYTRDLLPEYYRFIQGVVDSEDIPLNVSREMVQSSRLISQLRRLITNKITDLLNEKAADPDVYTKFWNEFGRFLKEGVATDRESIDTLAPLLRFNTLKNPDGISSLDDYVAALKPDQKKIYYLLGDDIRSTSRSPHLDIFRHQDLDVLLMVDPLDAFVVLSLTKFKEYELVNAANEKADLPSPAIKDEAEPKETLSTDDLSALIERFKTRLGDKVADVRSTDRLLDSPARLVDKEGALNQEVQRVYKLLHHEYEVPEKILEINPSHPLLAGLVRISQENEKSSIVIDQIYENALLIEGLHPDPAGMVDRIQQLMRAALE